MVIEQATDQNTHNEPPAIIKAVLEYAKKRGISEGAICRQIGVKQSRWSLVKHNHRKLDLELLQAISRGIPELQFQAIRYLVDGK